MITREQQSDLNRSPLDDAGVRFYLERREAGKGHQFALVAALNDFRDREKGMSWGAYMRRTGGSF